MMHTMLNDKVLYFFSLPSMLQNMVNNARIIQSDILIDGGVLHIIDDLLQPSIQKCNQHTLAVKYVSVAYSLEYTLQ